MAPARILVEPNAYHHLNVGDSAMLQIALERLRSLWPDAVREVITDAPDRLRDLDPRAVPVPAAGRRIWFGELVPAVHRRLGPRASRWLHDIESAARRRWGHSVGRLLRARYRIRGHDATDLERFLDPLRHADLLVVTGAGALNDEYVRVAVGVLDLVESFIRRGIPTAMMGQGVGPATSAPLLRRGRAVLPRVGILGLREGRMGPSIVQSLGVAAHRYVVTGDDALELAHRLPIVLKEPKLGVNLRRARYSGITAEVEQAVREAVTGFVRRHAIETVALPISFGTQGSDCQSIQAVLGAAEQPTPPPWPGPEEMARLAGRCRLVMTGSYHAAVFALAQGTPVVTIAASAYYRQKFFGLADLFGPGCEVVIAGDGDLRGRLLAALEAAWKRQPDVTATLRQAAREQIERSRAAYDRLRQVAAS